MPAGSRAHHVAPAADGGVWVSDFGGNAIHRFDPVGETFDTFDRPARPAEVRQILGRAQEIWGAQSADHSRVVIRPSP